MTASAFASAQTQRRRTTLHVALWIAQLLLAALFGMAGFLKLSAPFPQLAQSMPWTLDVPHALVRFIGLSELAAAIGLLLPSLTRIKPQLTALAALGLAIIMVLAMGFHAMRGELVPVAMNSVLGSIAAFVAWGRWRAAPITARDRR